MLPKTMVMSVVQAVSEGSVCHGTAAEGMFVVCAVNINLERHRTHVPIGCEEQRAYFCR